MAFVWILSGILSFLVALTVYAYNSFISLENRVDNAWAQISVQLKRRTDLIPNLVRLAQEYAEHEKDVFKNVSEARKHLSNASSPTEIAKANDEVTSSLNRLFAIAEDYPDLKANTNYLQIQEELRSTENKIAYARQHYNDVTTAYNTRLESIPFNLYASLFNQEQRELFQLDDSLTTPLLRNDE